MHACIWFLSWWLWRLSCFFFQFLSSSLTIFSFFSFFHAYTNSTNQPQKRREFCAVCERLRERDPLKPSASIALAFHSTKKVSNKSMRENHNRTLSCCSIIVVLVLLLPYPQGLRTLFLLNNFSLCVDFNYVTFAIDFHSSPSYYFITGFTIFVFLFVGQ